MRPMMAEVWQQKEFILLLNTVPPPSPLFSCFPHQSPPHIISSQIQRLPFGSNIIWHIKLHQFPNHIKAEIESQLMELSPKSYLLTEINPGPQQCASQIEVATNMYLQADGLDQ